MRLKVNVETINLNHSSQLHGCNHANPLCQFSFLWNCIGCLKNFVGINTVHTRIINTFYMVCFCGYKHNFMLLL